MKGNIEKYRGIIPAFYACYNEDGSVSVQRTKALVDYLIQKQVKGVYVCGSSGECIYQSKEERKQILEAVLEQAQGRLTVIAHVGCNNTQDSMELAAHAQQLGVDAIASIPPIYFHLPEYGVAQYWNDISSAAPKTDFIIYNIPQLAGTALTASLLKKMLENPCVIGVKNSSMPTQDIQIFKAICGQERVVFNGPDEQLVSGLAMGADGGIGGTYAVMPQLYLAIESCVKNGNIAKATQIQYAVNDIIESMCACHGNLYAVMKEILCRTEGLNLGGVRKPLPAITEQDIPQIERCAEKIKRATKEFC